MIELTELVMILEMHRQGLSVSAIARECGVDWKTIRKYIDRGLETPADSQRRPRQTVIDPFTGYLRERVTSYPGLTGQRLFRELKEMGYAGGQPPPERSPVSQSPPFPPNSTGASLEGARDWLEPVDPVRTCP